MSGVLERIVPGLAARYWASRARAAEMVRLYDLASAQSQGRYPALRGRGFSGDATVANIGTRLRDYARHLDENSDIAIGVLNTLCDQVAPVEPEPMVEVAGQPATAVNDTLAELWRAWTRAPDVAGLLPWGELKRMTARTLYRDGEVLVLPIEGRVSGAAFGTLPFALQVLEPDFCPLDKTDEAEGVIQGVRLNAWGRPEAYWLLERHPGGVLPFVAPRLLEQGRWIPADQVMHLKLTHRLPQVRGVSVFHGVATRLLDLKHYEESERIAARVAASFTAFIKRPAPLGATARYTPDGAHRAIEMQAGMVLDELAPGDGIEVVDPKRPNPAFGDFRHDMIRGIATGSGASYSTVSKDYSGTYSAQRQEMVEQQPRYQALRDYWVAAFLEPVYKRFVAHAVLDGAIRAPQLTLEELARASYAGATVPWIDPQKEVNADADAVDAGFKSRRQVIRERGGNPRMVDLERSRDTQPGAPRAPIQAVPMEEAAVNE